MFATATVPYYLPKGGIPGATSLCAHCLLWQHPYGYDSVLCVLLWGRGCFLKLQGPTSHWYLIPAEPKQLRTSPLAAGLGSKTGEKTLLGKKMQLPARFPSSQPFIYSSADMDVGCFGEVLKIPQKNYYLVQGPHF